MDISSILIHSDKHYMKNRVDMEVLIVPLKNEYFKHNFRSHNHFR